MTDLSPKDLLFISAYLREGCNGTRAAVVAGFAPRTASKSGARMLRRPEVAAEIARRQAEIAAKSGLTLIDLLAEAEQARAVAEEAGHAGAMVQATALRARLAGLLSERPGERAPDLEDAQGRELRTADALLAAAAESLGLPSDASPAMIVGATAKRSICPPEVYELLRAAQVPS